MLTFVHAFTITGTFEDEGKKRIKFTISTWCFSLLYLMVISLAYFGILVNVLWLNVMDIYHYFILSTIINLSTK